MTRAWYTLAQPLNETYLRVPLWHWQPQRPSLVNFYLCICFMRWTTQLWYTPSVFLGHVGLQTIHVPSKISRACWGLKVSLMLWRKCRSNIHSTCTSLVDLQYQSITKIVEILQLICHELFLCTSLRSWRVTIYQPLIKNIKARGWNATPLIVLASGARATTHIHSMRELETKLKLLTSQIRITFRQINIIATHYAYSILIYKRRIENRQPVDDFPGHVGLQTIHFPSKISRACWGLKVSLMLWRECRSNILSTCSSLVDLQCQSVTKIVEILQLICHELFWCTSLRSWRVTKYQPLIKNIKARGWNATPLIVLASGARASTHIPSMTELETKLKLVTSQIRNTFRQINIIATHYA
jgi:hypothetical protein